MGFGFAISLCLPCINHEMQFIIVANWVAKKGEGRRKPGKWFFQ
jgi:hypothetical protein